MAGPTQAEKLEWAKEQFDTGRLEGSPAKMARELREAGLDEPTIKKFAAYFVQRGIENDWLYSELGFSV